MTFSYEELTTRNIGFITQEQQDKLKASTVFICGTGGMGGAAIMALVRAGVGHLILADIDAFEVSNMNRQLFATLNSVDVHKAEATAEGCRQINPEIKIEIYKDDWTNHADDLVDQADLVINGTDDLRASLLLYRTSRAKGKSVIDAYASPLPSIYVTGPNDPSPEERLGYPTIGTEWHALSEQQRQAAFLCEAEYIILNSSSRHHVDVELAGEVAAGKRSRMSFAPMVITTGMLMAYESFAILLNTEKGTDHRGWFFNPYKARIEHPRPAVLTAIMRPLVRRFLSRMLGE